MKRTKEFQRVIDDCRASGFTVEETEGTQTVTIRAVWKESGKTAFALEINSGAVAYMLDLPPDCRSAIRGWKEIRACIGLREKS